MGALSGLSPMISALSANPSKPTSPIYLLPRFSDDVTGNRDWRVPIEVPSQLWLIHVGNAYEERDERGNFNIQIHASACSYQWFNFHKMFGNIYFSLILFLFPKINHIYLFTFFSLYRI